MINFWTCRLKQNLWLTSTPRLLFAEIKMLGLSRLLLTMTGCFNCRDSLMVSIICSVADADNAINGATVNALKPPIFLKAVRKSLPLHKLTNPLHGRCTCTTLSTVDYHTIQWCNELHRQLQGTSFLEKQETWICYAMVEQRQPQATWTLRNKHIVIIFLQI